MADVVLTMALRKLELHLKARFEQSVPMLDRQKMKGDFYYYIRKMLFMSLRRRSNPQPPDDR